MIKFVKDNFKFLAVAGAFSLLVISYFQQKENAGLRSKVKQSTQIIDSLSSEIFVRDIDLGRYEHMWERISETHPKEVAEIEHTTE